MIQEAEVLAGGFFYKDGKLVCEMFIVELGGMKHFHIRNHGGSTVWGFRRAIRFIRGKGKIYTNCKEGDRQTIRAANMLGFKEEARINGNILFSAEKT